MTSTISSNKHKCTIIKNELMSAKAWLIILPLIMLILTASMCIIYTSPDDSTVLTASDSVFSSEATSTNPQSIDKQRLVLTRDSIVIISYVNFAVMAVTMFFLTERLYASLYNKRKTDFYDALPVKRTELLWARTICAAVTLMLSLSAQLLITYIMLHRSTIYQKNSASMGFCLKAYLLSAVCAFAIYCLAQLCAVSSGKKWHYRALTAGMIFALPLAVNTVCVLPSQLCAGASDELANIFVYTSPAVIPFLYLDINNHGIALAAMAVICVVSTVLANYLFNRRKCECAQQSMSSNTVFIIDMLALIICTYSGYISVKPNQYYIILIVGIAASVLLCTIMSMLFYRKPIKKGIAIPSAVLCAVMCVYVAVLANGCFGWRDYVPPQSDIAKAQISFDLSSSNNYLMQQLYGYSSDNTQKYTLTDKEAVEAVNHIQKAYINDFGKNNRSSYDSNTKITYTLKNGKKISRTYTAYKDYTPLIYATEQVKKSQSFMNIDPNDDICTLSYNQYYNGDKTFEDGFIGNKAEYFKAICNDYMLMNADDFSVSNDGNPFGLSSFQFDAYIIKPNVDKATRDTLKSMSNSEIIDYYNRNYTESRMAALPISCVSISISANSKNTAALLERDGYIGKSFDIDAVDANSIQSVVYTKIARESSYGSYHNIGFENDSLTSIENPDTLLGCEVTSKAFYENNEFTFKSADDSVMIKNIFMQIRPKDNQSNLYKKDGENGYAVYFVSKNNECSRIYYVHSID